MDIQQKLDDWLASHPDAQKYVTALYYVPEGVTAPPDATHRVRLMSLHSAERALTIAAVVKPEFALFLDALLAMIATQPQP